MPRPEGGAGRPGNARVLAENVSALAFYVRDPDGETGFSRDYYSGWAENSNMLPEYVDVYLELLDDDAAGKTAELEFRGGDYTNSVERNVTRHTARVFFHNREGYKQR